MKKLLCIKPFIESDTGKSAISVGSVYKGTTLMPHLFQIQDDLGETLHVSSIYLKDISTETFKDFYSAYRGRCKDLSQELVNEFPDYLTLVRGHVLLEDGTKEQHWWTADAFGVIHDPSKLQFHLPIIEYIQFDGMCECENCGKKVPEAVAIFMGRYPACSNKCAGAIVGIEL